MGAHLGHMELMGLKGPLGDVVDPLGNRPILGEVDAKFDPIRVLMVAQLFQMLVVIGRVVIGKKQAAPVIAFHQHTFPVQVGKAQRPMDLIAALFPGKVLYRLKQGGGDLRIVDEIHLGKAHTAGVPFFIGPVAEDGADAANDLPHPGKPGSTGRRSRRRRYSLSWGPNRSDRPHRWRGRNWDYLYTIGSESLQSAGDRPCFPPVLR